MYDSFIDIWEGSPMWGQHTEDWKTPEDRNDDSPDHWIVELADNGWMDHICPHRYLYGGGNDDGYRHYD